VQKLKKDYREVKLTQALSQLVTFLLSGSTYPADEYTIGTYENLIQLKTMMAKPQSEQMILTSI
jgi:hypothetical protein